MVVGKGDCRGGEQHPVEEYSIYISVSEESSTMPADAGDAPRCVAT